MTCASPPGVKEVPVSKLLSDRTYMFFSHTIKGQEYNMPLLDACLSKNIQLMDYERIVAGDGNRLVKFGKFAGYAGMIGQDEKEKTDGFALTTFIV